MKIRRCILLVALPVILLFVGVWAYAGRYGLNVLVRHGGIYWLPLKTDSKVLSSSMREALASDPQAYPGPYKWRTIAPGFEVTDMPVRARAAVVDHIYLARIDPGRYRFVLRNDPARNLDQWMSHLGAALVVNASYYARDGRPATPFLSDGVLLGPRNYEARAGAFVASPDFVGVRNLSQQSWQDAFQGADNAMVSFPLLVADGATHVKVKSQWLANRSFIGKDKQGRIVIGTTTDAFFTLARLAEFLQTAPLDLVTALNLDGGPVACQGVSLNGYKRKTYGAWEAQVKGEQVKLLRRPVGGADIMPVVLAVFPK